jgi:hypothetical protein
VLPKEKKKKKTYRKNTLEAKGLGTWLKWNSTFLANMKKKVIKNKIRKRKKKSKPSKG